MDLSRTDITARDRTGQGADDRNAALEGALDAAARAPFALRPQPRREARVRNEASRRVFDARPVCRIVSLKAREGLSVSLARLLDRTLGEVRFSVDPEELDGRAPDWVWVCGFEPDDLERVRALRAALGSARLLVTGRRIDPSWRQILGEAGVDLVLPWPYPLAALREHLLAPV